jgi:hypothetical protein
VYELNLNVGAIGLRADELKEMEMGETVSSSIMSNSFSQDINYGSLQKHFIEKMSQSNLELRSETRFRKREDLLAC